MKESEKTVYVTYTSSDEMIVCVLEDEQTMLREFFPMESGRNLSDYDRMETKDFPYVSARLSIGH